MPDFGNSEVALPQQIAVEDAAVHIRKGAFLPTHGIDGRRPRPFCRGELVSIRVISVEGGLGIKYEIGRRKQQEEGREKKKSITKNNCPIRNHLHNQLRPTISLRPSFRPCSAAKVWPPKGPLFKGPLFKELWYKELLSKEMLYKELWSKELWSKVQPQ